MKSSTFGQGFKKRSLDQGKKNKKSMQEVTNS